MRTGYRLPSNVAPTRVGSPVVEPLIEDAAEAAREAGAETVAVDVEPCAALADDRLATAVEELATNAPEHGATAVELSARAVDGGVEIAVTDDGPGIHESESRVITGRDPRRRNWSTRAGSALIVRATADAFDGWLSIETRRAGRRGRERRRDPARR